MKVQFAGPNEEKTMTYNEADLIWIAPKSVALEYIAYDVEEKILFVTFQSAHNGNLIYFYEDVSAEEFATLLTPDRHFSVGQYFNANIRNCKEAGIVNA